MGIKKIFITLLMFLFVLPVIAAIGWDTSDLVYLSSMSEEENHVGIGISNLVLLSSMEEDLGHIGEGISGLVYLSSMSDEENHLGEEISALCMLSSVRYGDIDNNTLVESFDASLILQYFCLMEPQAAPLPWEEWRQTISDVDGNSEIEAFDASLILQYSVDLIDIFPVENQSSRKEVSNRESREITRKEEKIINYRRH